MNQWWLGPRQRVLGAQPWLSPMRNCWGDERVQPRWFKEMVRDVTEKKSVRRKRMRGRHFNDGTFDKRERPAKGCAQRSEQRHKGSERSENWDLDIFESTKGCGAEKDGYYNNGVKFLI
ncbi:hypothetical protein TNCV_828841 [Trichonephila clavipes]|nr:hypothetical protein TNCV_828841 [Trichonephila clavipes]